jgi:hypothetical protein
MGEASLLICIISTMSVVQARGGISHQTSRYIYMQAYPIAFLLQLSQCRCVQGKSNHWHVHMHLPSAHGAILEHKHPPHIVLETALKRCEKVQVELTKLLSCDAYRSSA